MGVELRKKGTEKVFAWLWKDEDGEKYFDTLQAEAVEAAMQAEVVAVTGRFRNIMSMFLRFRDGIILTWV